MKLRVWFSSSIAVGITIFLVGGVFHISIRCLVPDILQQYKTPALFRDWEG